MTLDDGADEPGFHDGELAVQSRAGVRHEAERLAGMLAPPDLRGGASRFLADRTFAALTARDDAGRLWVAPLSGRPGFLDVRDSRTLDVHAVPMAGDPLHGIGAGQPAGLLAIDFFTRRRMRVNGTLLSSGDSCLTVSADEAYGNCPQYIQQRALNPRTDDHVLGALPGRPSQHLSLAAISLIERADTFILGTTHPTRGNDASHRGGPPGFVRVSHSSDRNGGQGTLWWPDYAGNNLFNSFGNLAVDGTAALLFLDFNSGDSLHLSGSATVDWTGPGTTGDDGGTGRRVMFHLKGAMEVDRAFAPGADRVVPYPRNPPLTDRPTRPPDER